MFSLKVKDFHPRGQIRHRFRKVVADHGGDISFSSFVKWLLSKVILIIIKAIITSSSWCISRSQRFLLNFIKSGSQWSCQILWNPYHRDVCEISWNHKSRDFAKCHEIRIIEIFAIQKRGWSGAILTHIGNHFKIGWLFIICLHFSISCICICTCLQV